MTDSSSGPSRRCGRRHDRLPSVEWAVDTNAARRSQPLWAVVLAACVGQFLVVLDVAVVNVALPSMRADLGMSATGLQWVVNAYTLTFAGFMLLGGRAADLFGRKRMFLLGLGLFTAASLAGGLAQQSWQLVGARAVQGVGAVVLAPSTLTILTTSVPEVPARTRAIGMWTAVGAGGGAAGALIGGVLTDALSWRWVLLINVPVGALVVAAAVVWLVETRARTARGLDIPGGILVTGGLGALAYGIVQTESNGWVAAATLIALLSGVVLLGLFVAVEAQVPEPLMPLRLFRLRSVSAANGAMFLCGAALVSSWYFLSLHTQNVLHLTPLQTGLAFVPLSIAAAVGAILAPRLMARLGARNAALTGVLMAAAGYIWLSDLDADGGYVQTVLAPAIVVMLGIGLLATPLASIATSGVPADDAGIGSGVINTCRTMGGALGLAILATLAAAHTAGSRGPQALASGYALAFQIGAAVLVFCALLMLATLRGESETPRGRSPHST